MYNKLSLDLPLEWIPIAIVEKHFYKFNECENLWKDAPEKETKDIQFPPVTTENLIKRIGRISLGADDRNKTIEVLKERLADGKVFNDLCFYYRIKTDFRKCPLCGSSMEEHDIAISRIDNETEICSSCGQREAFGDFFNFVN